MRRTEHRETLTLEKIVGGGQALGTLADGRKCFVWGGLPGETVEVLVTKKKSSMAEGVVERVVSASSERIEPTDRASYLSTSPWQIMSFEAEQRYKSQLVDEAFVLHGVTLPSSPNIYSDGVQFGYRNKVEFSWYGDLERDENGTEYETLDLAFFKRGSKGKIAVDGTSLARAEINVLARTIRDLLHQKSVSARELKTLLIRANQRGDCVWQLYVKNEHELASVITPDEANRLPAQGGEIIYSDPRSPASRITKRLASFGTLVLSDTILDTEFRYATEGFFQVNIPVYERALRDMTTWVTGSSDAKNGEVIDLYSGVGSIGLTIGGDTVTLVEVNEDAVREMRENIARLHSNAQAVLAPTEKALEYIHGNGIIIVDPPRAGLHADVIKRLLETRPPRIIYLSCNPVTQARDVSLLLDTYTVVHHQGYNFFPRTPHIEHLVILDRRGTTR